MPCRHESEDKRKTNEDFAIDHCILLDQEMSEKYGKETTNQLIWDRVSEVIG